MNLQEKIEEIRQQPQHIRWRYTVGSVALSMVFVIGIWAMSLSQSFSQIGDSEIGVGSESIGEVKNKLLEGKTQFDSLRESLKQSASATNDESNRLPQAGPHFPIEGGTEMQPLPAKQPDPGVGSLDGERMLNR